MAKTNPSRFSTKYQHYEADLVYSGYRNYNLSLGNWVNRDPIRERGGKNLFTFVQNDPMNRIDPEGRAPIIIGGIILGMLLTGSASDCTFSQPRLPRC